MELLKELEPTLGKLIKVDAAIEDVYIPSVENTCTNHVITVQFEPTKVKLKLEYDEYGVAELNIITYVSCEDDVGSNEHEELFLDLMEVKNITVEALEGVTESIYDDVQSNQTKGVNMK